MRGLDLDVPAGSWAGIGGGPTADTSALLAVIAGRRRPDAGELLLGGRPLDAGRVGYVTGEHRLIGTLTAVENLAVVPYDMGGSPSRRWARAEEQLAAVGLPSSSWHNLTEQLSGGQQQRVAIARAIVTSPTILLADEPTGNLDTQRSHEIMDLLVALNRDRGITVLMVTHEPDMACYAKRVIHFLDGRVDADHRNGEKH